MNKSSFTKTRKKKINYHSAYAVVLSLLLSVVKIIGSLCLACSQTSASKKPANRIIPEQLMN
jgi:hypothetical protein